MFVLENIGVFRGCISLIKGISKAVEQSDFEICVSWKFTFFFKGYWVRLHRCWDFLQIEVWFLYFSKPGHLFVIGSYTMIAIEVYLITVSSMKLTGNAKLGIWDGKTRN